MRYCLNGAYKYTYMQDTCLSRVCKADYSVTLRAYIKPDDTLNTSLVLNQTFTKLKPIIFCAWLRLVHRNKYFFSSKFMRLVFVALMILNEIITAMEF